MKAVHHKRVYSYGDRDIFYSLLQNSSYLIKHRNHWQLLCKSRLSYPAFKIVFKIICPLFYCFPRPYNMTNKTDVLRMIVVEVFCIKSLDISKYIRLDWRFLSFNCRRHLSARTAWWGMAPWWLAGSLELWSCRLGHPYSRTCGSSEKQMVGWRSH